LGFGFEPATSGGIGYGWIKFPPVVDAAFNRKGYTSAIIERRVILGNISDELFLKRRICTSLLRVLT
jgi:hypothetical protein